MQTRACQRVLHTLSTVCAHHSSYGNTFHHKPLQRLSFCFSHTILSQSKSPRQKIPSSAWTKGFKSQGFRVPYLLIPLNALSIRVLGLPLTSANVSNESLLSYNYIYLVAGMSTVSIRIGCLFIWYKCCRWDPSLVQEW